MRYKFYKRAIGQMKHKKFVALIFILVSLVSSLSVGLKKEMVPAVKVASESRAQALATRISNEIIESHMQELKYSKLVELKYGEDGRLTSISANSVEMSKLSAQIVKEIQERLSQIGDSTIQIPIGRMLGWSIFSGYGPKINIKILPAGNVKADFKSEFISQGINQTKHTIYIELNTEMVVIAPFLSETITVKNIVTVAETVIVGEIPNTYFTIENDGYIKSK